MSLTITVPSLWKYLFVPGETAGQYEEYSTIPLTDDVEKNITVFEADNQVGKSSTVTSLTQSPEDLMFIYYLFLQDGVSEEVVTATNKYFEYLYALDNAFNDASAIAMNFYTFTMIYLSTDSDLKEYKEMVNEIVETYSDPAMGYDALNASMQESYEEVQTTFIAYNEKLNEYTSKNEDLSSNVSDYITTLQQTSEAGIYLSEDSKNAAMTLKQKAIDDSTAEAERTMDMVNISVNDTTDTANEIQSNSADAMYASDSNAQYTINSINNETDITEELESVKTAYITEQLADIGSSVVNSPQYVVETVEENVVTNALANYVSPAATSDISERASTIIIIVTSIVSAIMAILILLFIGIDVYVFKSPKTSTNN